MIVAFKCVAKEHLDKDYNVDTRLKRMSPLSLLKMSGLCHRKDQVPSGQM